MQAEIQFYRAEQVAQILQVSRSQVYTLIREGKIKSCLVGGRSRRISKEALDAFAREQEDSDRND